MAIEGPLKELNIHDVFQLLDLGRKTGVLRITSELRQNAGVVCFEQGAVVAAHIASNPHPLGGLLLKAGKLGEEDLARARRMQETGDARRFGEILIAIGAVSRRDLERCVRAQVEEVVFELLSWSEGYFSFTDGAAERAAAEATVAIPTEAVLMEAARRIDEWSRIETKVPHLGVVPRLRPADGASAAPLDLVPFEWEVLAAVDGARDLREIAEHVRRSDFDVARTIYGLTGAGLIALEDVRPSPAPPPAHDETAERVRAHLASGDHAAARAAAEALVAADPANADGHLAVGRVRIAAGQFEGAATALVRAAALAPDRAAPRRLLGLAFAALGRFGDAVESWDQWAGLAAREPEEGAHAGAIGQLRGAAELLAEALGGCDGNEVRHG
ncbi:MAG TPA: DUF4388 domain-containing protein [Gemmatimonadales bacterium]|nr:DUF4388 domain-containing protein [Gemmatimonadales bacterium]